jgi:hypothetical protein
VTRFLDAGMQPNQIDSSTNDLVARLLSDAQTSAGRAYATAYDETVRTYVADARDADRPAAVAGRPGEPHPDPFLPGRGWQGCESGCGAWVRRSAEAAPVADREAC